MATHSMVLAWRIPWTEATVHGVTKRMTEQVTLPCMCAGGFPDGSGVKNPPCNARDVGLKDPLEKGMATHSSILAWRIPWTEEPGGLWSMGSHRVGLDRATNTFTPSLESHEKELSRPVVKDL